jgi:hypothetical protein
MAYIMCVVNRYWVVMVNNIQTVLKVTNWSVTNINHLHPSNRVNHIINDWEIYGATDSQSFTRCMRYIDNGFNKHQWLQSPIDDSILFIRSSTLLTTCRPERPAADVPNRMSSKMIQNGSRLYLPCCSCAYMDLNCKQDIYLPWIGLQYRCIASSAVYTRPNYIKVTLRRKQNGQPRLNIRVIS